MSTGAAAFVLEALAGPAPRALLAIDYGSDPVPAAPPTATPGHRVVSDVVAAPGLDRHHGGRRLRRPHRDGPSGGLHAFPTVSQLDALIALGFEDWLRTELEHQRDQLSTGRGADAVRTWGGRSARLAARGPGRARTVPLVRGGDVRDVAEPSWLGRRANGGHRASPEPAHSPPRRTRSIARYCSHTIEAVSTNMNTVAADA